MVAGFRTFVSQRHKASAAGVLGDALLGCRTKVDPFSKQAIGDGPHPPAELVPSLPGPSHIPLTPCAPDVP